MKVGKVRAIVFARDKGCVAPVIDPDAGLCYDQWGKHISANTLPEMEMDYVRFRSHGAHHELPKDHVTVCPGHHRGAGPSAGYQWATHHRADERAYLEAHYERR